MEFLPIKKDGCKVYAGFSQRFVAGIIDAIILIPLVYLLYYLGSFSITAAMVTVVISSLLYSVYSIFFHLFFQRSPPQKVLDLPPSNFGPPPQLRGKEHCLYWFGTNMKILTIFQVFHL